MVKRDGLVDKLRVTADGSGQVGHAGSALLAGTADRIGLTRALSEAMAPTRQRASAHDPGVVLRDLVVMLADGGDCLADLGALRDQPDLFGAVASDSTAFRVIDSIDAACLERLRGAVATARSRAWTLGARPARTVIDVDATLTGAYSEKEQAAGNFKGGYGHHPLLCYLDGTGEGLAAILRPGNAGSNTAADHVLVLDLALEQLDQQALEGEILVRIDGAGASHEVTRYCRDARLRFSVGFDLDERVRDAISRTARVGMGTRDPRRRQPARALPGRRDHRSRRSLRLARGIEADRTTHQAARRRPAELRRRRRLPPVGLPRRQQRQRPRARSRPSRPRPRRGPHPPSQGLRPCEPAVSELRSQPGLAVAGRCSPQTSSPGPRRCASPTTPRRGSSSGCATGCFTSPDGSPATPAGRRCASPATGPGPDSSPPPSRACRRCRAPTAT